MKLMVDKGELRLAINRAIDAVEGEWIDEPRRDVISRQAAIDALGKDPSFKVKLFGKSYDEGRSDQWFKDVHALTTLPSVQPERKKGEWIKIDKYDKESNVQCSVCLEDFDYIDGVCYLCHGYELPLFCPNCGADMRGEEE